MYLCVMKSEQLHGPASYQIVSLENYAICADNLSLKQAVNEIRHAAPFAIRNSVTGLFVCLRLARGFTPTTKQIKSIPKAAHKIANSRHTWNFHPAQ